MWATLTFALIALRAAFASPTGECTTPGCIRTASEILKNMDSSVDPCDDFYKFACGGYIRDTTLRGDQLSINSFSQIVDKINQQLKTMFEEPIQAGEAKPFTLVKRLYSACMDVDAIEKDGLTTAKSILKKIGGWPVVEGSEWKEGQVKWMEVLHTLHQHGLSHENLMSVGIQIDQKNSSRQIVTLDQPSLGLARDQLLEGLSNNVVKAYYEYFVDLAVLFGADKEYALAEYKEVMKLIHDIAEIETPDENRRDLTRMYNPMPIRELQQKFPSVQWVKYFDTVVGIPEVKFTEDDLINVIEPEFLKKLEDLINKTPNRVMANYIVGRVALSMTPYLHSEVKVLEQKFKKNAYGVSSSTPRWEECLPAVSGNIGIATSALYVRKYFDEDAKQNAQTLVDDLKAAFLDMVKKIDWMDESTRTKSIAKAEAIIAHIGYPKELLDDSKLEDYYQDLEFDDEVYMKLDMKLKKFITDTSSKKIRAPVDKADWRKFATVATVNAGYDSDDNGVQLPAGILQGVFFGKDKPHYMNYGAIGFVIGHEVTHGFDDQGSQFNKEGELDDWWEPHTKAAFLEKANCIIEQYGNFTVPSVGMNLNGKNTQGENIADNGGIKEAYLAYKAWVERNGEESPLPGLSYTPQQMFWISAANPWCSIERDQAMRMQIMTDVHSPNYFRVFGVFGNSDYFAQDFNCPVGSKMNPVHKCHVW